jgi:hypothetical protein
MPPHPLLAVALVSSITFVSRAEAQATFEGVTTFKTTVSGKSIESRYYAKGQRFRQEMAMGGTSAVTITNFGEGKNYTLLPTQKKYLVMDYKAAGKALQEMVGKDKKPIANRERPKITATGNKETVAGYSCEHYTMEVESGEIDLCVAKGLGYFAMGGNPMGGGGMDALSASNPRYRELIAEFKDGFFPLKTMMTQDGLHFRGDESREEIAVRGLVRDSRRLHRDQDPGDPGDETPVIHALAVSMSSAMTSAVPRPELFNTAKE